MKTSSSPAGIRRLLEEYRRAGRSIGLVPTMGALHAGHESLIRMARERTACTVVSIFVNPRQFGAGEDFERYPRPLERDEAILERLGCDLLFMPPPQALYSASDSTSITVAGLAERLCGASRPGHFAGVLLVVAKLLNIIRPDAAFLGQKDAQQAVLIQRMAADLDFPVRIAIGPTVREEDGLALSSRNSYLGTDARGRATGMRHGLLAALEAVRGGERAAGPLRRLMRGRMEAAGFAVDYADVVDGRTLEPLERLGGVVLLAAAGVIGGTRLIDNIALRLEGAAVEEMLLEFPEWSRYER